MTLLEAIKSGDIDYIAGILYGVMVGTEERILGNLEALGLEVSLCTLSEDARIAQIKEDLLQEVPDDT